MWKRMFRIERVEHHEGGLSLVGERDPEPQPIEATRFAGRTALVVWPTGWSRELKIAGVESGPQIAMHFELPRELAHADELAYGVVLVSSELLPERKQEPSAAVTRAKTSGAVGVTDEPNRTVGGPSRVDIDGWREALATASLPRALGSLLGMACGDALGTTNEFKKMSAPAFPELATGPVNDVVGGGPFRLEARGLPPCSTNWPHNHQSSPFGPAH